MINLKQTLKGTAVLALLFFAQTSFALDASDLINGAKNYNLQEVTIVGEAIGDLMERGENGWVNISDGKQAIGVWSSALLLEQIKFLGGYKHKGDRVRIVGRFNEACREHGGDMDLHATALIITEKGNKISYPINQAKLIGIFFLLGLLVFLLILRYRALTREQKN